MSTVFIDPAHGQYTNPFEDYPYFFEGTQMFKLAEMIAGKLNKSGITAVNSRSRACDNPLFSERIRNARSDSWKNGEDGNPTLILNLHIASRCKLPHYISEEKENSTSEVRVEVNRIKDTSAKLLGETLAKQIGRAMEVDYRVIGLDVCGALWKDYPYKDQDEGDPNIISIVHGRTSCFRDETFLANDENLWKLADIEASIICSFFNCPYAGAGLTFPIEMLHGQNCPELKQVTLHSPIKVYHRRELAAIESEHHITTFSGTVFTDMDFTGTCVVPVSQTEGVIEGWAQINRGDFDQEPAQVPTGSRDRYYTVYKYLYKYANAADAKEMKNSIGLITPGIYKAIDYETTTNNGHLVKLSETMGFTEEYWINDYQNRYFNYVVYDETEMTREDPSRPPTMVEVKLGDIVRLRDVLEPEYTVTSKMMKDLPGKIRKIPLSTCIWNNWGRGFTVGARSQNRGFMVYLKEISAWVDIGYVRMYKQLTEEEREEYIKTSHEEITTLSEFEFNSRVSPIPKTSEYCETETKYSYEAIMGKFIISKEKMYLYLKDHNPNIKSKYIDWYYNIGTNYGVRPDVAMAQAILETEYFTNVYYNNPGMVGRINGVSQTIQTFPNMEKGITAHIQQLYSLACAEGLPRGERAIAQNFYHPLRNHIKRWVELDEVWVGCPGYGKKILDIWAAIADSRQ